MHPSVAVSRMMTDHKVDRMHNSLPHNNSVQSKTCLYVNSPCHELLDHMYTDSQEFIVHSCNAILYSDIALLPLHTIMAVFMKTLNWGSKMVEGPNCHIMKVGKTQNQDALI